MSMVRFTGLALLTATIAWSAGCGDGGAYAPAPATPVTVERVAETSPHESPGALVAELHEALANDPSDVGLLLDRTLWPTANHRDLRRGSAASSNRASPSSPRSSSDSPASSPAAGGRSASRFRRPISSSRQRATTTARRGPRRR